MSKLSCFFFLNFTFGSLFFNLLLGCFSLLILFQLLQWLLGKAVPSKEVLQKLKNKGRAILSVENFPLTSITW